MSEEQTTETSEGEVIHADFEVTDTEQEQTATAVVVSDDDCGPYSLTLEVSEERMQQLGNFVRKSNRQIIECNNDMSRMAYRAAFITELRKAVDGPVLSTIMKLQGSRLGFKTDRDAPGKKAYEPEVVCDVAIEAFSRGFRMDGNETNIIAGNFYGTLEGYTARLNELEGFSNLRLQIGSAEVLTVGGKEQARVPVSASWTYFGVADSLECKQEQDGDYRIALKYYSTDTDQLLEGKAKRTIKKRIYEIVTNQDLGDDPDLIDGEITARKVEPEPKPAANKVPTKDPEPEPPIMDRVEAFLLARLAGVESKGDVTKIQKIAIGKLKKAEATDEEYAACKEYIDTLCNAKRDDITAHRGERSNDTPAES